MPLRLDVPNAEWWRSKGQVLYLVQAALSRKLVDSVLISCRYAPQSDIVHEQGPRREIDSPGSVPRPTYFCRDAIVGQAGGLLVGLDGTLHAFSNPIIVAIGAGAHEE